jgi:excisionase family DNA binding protein
MNTDGTDSEHIFQTGRFPVVPDGHLSVPEAADRTGLSQRAIRRALTEGRLTGAQMMGRWMIPADVLDDYARTARRHRANSAAAPTAQHPALPELVELVEQLQSVVDRAVAAELRAQAAETQLRLIESTATAAETQREQLQARVAELETQLAARRRSWWPWARDRDAAAA